MIRLYIAIAIISAIAAAYWRYDYVVKKLERTEASLTQANWVIGEHERIQKEDAEFTKKALDEKEALKRENDTYASNINSGKYRMYIKASCPKISEASNATQSSETYAELDPGVRQSILRFRSILGDVQSDFNDCKARLKSLSQ